MVLTIFGESFFNFIGKRQTEISWRFDDFLDLTNPIYQFLEDLQKSRIV